MAAEIEQKPPLEKDGPKENSQSSDALRPNLDDYQNYAKQNQETGGQTSLESDPADLSDNSLVISPLFGRDNKSGQVSQRDSKKDLDNTKEDLEDKGDTGLDSETQRAKDDFVQIMTDRFKDDPRSLDSTYFAQKLEEMDQRILHERVQRGDGSFVDQQEQLAEVYRNLSRIGTEAEKLTYKAKDGSERQVYSEPWMVNNILASSILRSADPINFYNQGANNTCAAESINRQGNQLLAGEDSKTIADICTKGEFEAKDIQGNSFTCTVDKKSLALDRQAQQIYYQPTDARDAYGQLGDIRTAQLNLDLMSRREFSAKGYEGGEGRYVYKKVSPTSQRDTGERVVDTIKDKVIAHSPCLDARGMSDVKQSLFGRYIDPNFAKDTTIVAGNAFNVSNVTAVSSGTQLKTHLARLEAKGWELSTVGTHVGNYVARDNALGGAQGWHATSMQLNDKGGVDFINNWGGAHNYKNLNAERLFAWMHAPASASAADRRRGDHIFNPDGIDTDREGNPVRAELTDKQNKADLNKSKDEDEQLAQLKKAHQREEEDRFREQQYIRTRVTEIESRLASLSHDSPQKTQLLAQKKLLENNSNIT